MKKLFLFTAANLLAWASFAEVTVSNCFIREAITGSDMTAAYMMITNTNHETAVVKSAALPDLSEHVELHDMTMDNGVMKMFPIDEITVEHGQTVELKQGGMHIMVMQLKKAPMVGESYNIELTLADDSKLNCNAPVLALKEIHGADTPHSEMPMMDHGHMNHGKMHEVPKK